MVARRARSLVARGGVPLCVLLSALGCSSATDSPSSNPNGGAATGGTSGSTSALGGANSGENAGSTNSGAANAGDDSGSASANASGGHSPSAGGASNAGNTAAGGAGAAGAAGTAGASAGSAGAGGASNDPCGPSNPARVALPMIPNRSFQLTAYGALGDDKTDDTKALQAALNAASSAGGGTVVVPAGTFLSGPVTIGSSTNLELTSDAVLKMLPMAAYNSTTAFITAADATAHDISITGAGTIDGQGQAWWDAFAADSSVARPQAVSLGHVTRLLIDGIRLQNPPEEHIWVKGDTDVTITGISIATPGTSGQNPPKNTDGIDISATRAFLCNDNITAGDDNIALNGTNIYIAYSTFGLGHGCSIGSITKSGVDQLTVDHVTFNGTTSGIRMKSARDRGGLVQNLTYSNITMSGVQNPVYITSYYPTLPTDPKADTAQAVTATTPQWQNITLKNVTATGSDNAGILWGLPEEGIKSLTFDNVKIQAKKGMEIIHASGITFSNGSSVTAKSGAAVQTYDATVTGVATTAL